MQEEIPAALVFALFLAAGGGMTAILITMVRRSGRLADEEAGRTPLFTTRCGGRVGRIKYSGPFVRVALYEELMVIGARKPIVLRRVDIDRIVFEHGRRSAVFGKTVNIHHRLTTVRSPICLYSSTGLQLAERLAALVHPE